MRAGATGGKLAILCSFLMIGAFSTEVANATIPRSSESSGAEFSASYQELTQTSTPLRGRHASRRWHRVSCVPFARSDSKIEIVGNAWQWWEHAAGVYARGSQPELGGVLVFEPNPIMRLGHVAVVSRIYNSREIEVDQSNWPIGHGATYSVPVIDVSARNDWTAVRVALGKTSKFGSIYPTYGFIYSQPDTGTFIAAVSQPAAPPRINPPPADLRRPGIDAKLRDLPDQEEEVAEAPDVAPRQGWHAHVVAHRVAPEDRDTR